MDASRPQRRFAAQSPKTRYQTDASGLVSTETVQALCFDESSGVGHNRLLALISGEGSR